MARGPAVLLTPSWSRSALLAVGLLLTTGAWMWVRHAPHPPSYQLSLAARSSPCAIYFSAWDDGPVVADHDGSDGKVVTYHRQFEWVDGCTWESTEVLRPLSGDRYTYFYDEQVVSCPEGIESTGIHSPRSGVVTLTPLAEAAPSTPLFR